MKCNKFKNIPDPDFRLPECFDDFKRPVLITKKYY